MAENGATQEHKEKMPADDPEAAFGDHELDDSKAKFINGGVDDTQVVIKKERAAFTGLGKEELKRYAEDPFWIRLRWIMFILFWVGWLAMLVSAIVIIVLAPRCPTRPDLKWYNKDVSYNVYAKSFLDGDSAQDGFGDLEGVQQKEGYISGLNAKAIWLSSILKTDGNDRAVLEYKELDEKFGALDSLRAFCKKLLKTGKRVVMDMVPNQTSRNHTWFKSSEKKDGKYAGYYVWSASKPDWKREDGSDMWVRDPVRGEYYLSQFDGTADLNLTNPDVIAEFKEIFEFWAINGISGFHINDLEYLSENGSFVSDDSERSQTRNFPDNVNVVDSLRGIVDGLDNKPGREKLLFGTVRNGGAEQVKMYFGGEDKKGLHVVSVMMDDLTTDVKAAGLETSLKEYVNVSASGWLGWRLTSARPGSQRIFSRIGASRLMTAHALQALLPGSSLPYYGDEIAMDDGGQGTETVTPMQWSKEVNAGFTTGKPWVPVNSDYMIKNLESLTAQLQDNTMMTAFMSLNSLREEESLQFGQTTFCSTENLLIFSRSATGFDSYLVVANLGGATAHKFGGDACVGDKTSAELVFHSHELSHENTILQLDEAVSIAEGEVLVFKFAV